MKKAEIDKKVIEHFKNSNSFTRTELLEFYQKFEPELNNRTFGWRVWNLKKNNVIHSVGAGIYAINRKEIFKPEIEPIFSEIHEKIMKRMAVLGREVIKNDLYCLWSTSWLNQFIIHQLFSTYIILEVNESYIESTFYSLKEDGVENLFYKPDKDIFDKYMTNQENAIIVKPLYTRSPIQRVNKVRLATIEKILVDLYCDSSSFYFVQGKELRNIFENAIKSYNINFTKLLNYAARRRSRNEIKGFISNHIESELKEHLM